MFFFYFLKKKKYAKTYATTMSDDDEYDFNAPPENDEGDEDYNLNVDEDDEDYDINAQDEEEDEDEEYDVGQRKPYYQLKMRPIDLNTDEASMVEILPVITYFEMPERGSRLTFQFNFNNLFVDTTRQSDDQRTPFKSPMAYSSVVYSPIYDEKSRGDESVYVSRNPFLSGVIKFFRAKIFPDPNTVRNTLVGDDDYYFYLQSLLQAVNEAKYVFDNVDFLNNFGQSIAHYTFQIGIFGDSEIVIYRDMPASFIINNDMQTLRDDAGEKFDQWLRKITQNDQSGYEDPFEDSELYLDRGIFGLRVYPVKKQMARNLMRRPVLYAQRPIAPHRFGKSDTLWKKSNRKEYRKKLNSNEHFRDMARRMVAERLRVERMARQLVRRRFGLPYREILGEVEIANPAEEEPEAEDDDDVNFQFREEELYDYEAYDHEMHMYMIWKTIPQTGNRLCIAQSLIDCGYDPDELGAGDTTDIDELILIIKDHKLPIAIMYNIPETNGDHRTTTENTKKFSIGKRSVKTFYPLKDDNVVPTFAYAPKDYHLAGKVLVWDQERKHIERLDGINFIIPRLLPNIYMDEYTIVKTLDGIFDDNDEEDFLVIRDFADYTIPFEPPAAQDEVTYIFFDFECIAEMDGDFSSKPFSVSFLDVNGIETRMIQNLERIMTIQEIEAFSNESVINYQGFNCVELFLDWIYHNKEGKQKIILVGFNNAKYDNFILLRTLVNRTGRLGKDDVNYVEYHGETIGNIRFFDNKCEVWDLSRHLSGTLLDICKKFKIVKCCKIDGGIDHTQTQYTYNMHKDNFMEELHKYYSADTIKRYNNFDVISLATAFTYFLEDLMMIDFMPHVSKVLKYSSMPQLMYDVARKHWKKEKIDLPQLTMKQYHTVVEATYGARSDVFNAAQTSTKEECVSMDVKSMYPYVMFAAPVEYPAGEIVEYVITAHTSLMLKNNFDRKKFRFGCYVVDIDQTNLILQRLPLIVCKKTKDGNLYEYDNDEVVIQKGIRLNSVDIYELLKYGCDVKFVVGEKALEFTEKIGAYKVFGFLSELMMLKNISDDTGSRPALRKICKDASNALSGKCMQEPNTITHVIIPAHNYYSHIAKTKNVVDGSLFVKGMISPKRVVIQYTKTDEAIKTIKNAYLSTFIYAHARAYMYEHLLKRVGQDKMLQMDTDCGKMTITSFNEIKTYLNSTLVPYNEDMKKHFPDHIENVKLFDPTQKSAYGCFVNELIPGNNILLINAKKEWCSATLSPTGEIINLKYSLKGVKPKSLYVSDTTDLELFAQVDERRRAKVQVHTLATLYHAVNNNNTLDNPRITLQLFQDVVEKNKYAYVLNQMLARSIAESHIFSYYIIKLITPANFWKF